MIAPRTINSNTNRLYFSARLTAKLKDIPSATTTIICAPEGYGKTTAAREFLNQHLPRKATPKGATLRKEALHWLACIEEPAFVAWERFCRVIQKIDSEAGGKLLAMGLPDEDTQSEVVTLLMEIEPNLLSL